MNSTGREDLHRTLFQLRRRRGPFAHKNAWLGEVARVRSLLRPGSLELQAFEAVEVEGLTYKAAAARLGFSERHLYRIRESMIEQILNPSLQHVSVEPRQPVAREIELAGTLLTRGHSSAVPALVQRTLDTPAGAPTVIEALTLRARALSEVEDFDGARKTLAEARRYVTRLEGAEEAKR